MFKSKGWVATTILLTALSMPAHAETPIFGDFGAPAWSRMFKYIESRFGAVANDEVVMVLPTATNAAWDDPIQTYRFMEMYKWGDWMPSQAWQYAPNSGKRVSDGYQYFLTSAWNAAVARNGTLSQEARAALLRVSDEVTFTRGEYAATEQAAAIAYDAYIQTKPWPRLSKNAFYKDRGWSIEIRSKKDRLDQALQTLKVITGQIVDPDIQLLNQAVVRYNNPEQKMWLPPVRDALNDRERWQQYYVSYLDKDIDAFLKESAPQHQTIDESQSQSDYFEQRWHASVSVSFLGLFRGGGASAEQQKIEQHVKSNVTKIDVSFSNLDTFNITRGDWFSENVVSRFAPYFKGESYTTIWGPNGQLELLPKTLLVGRGTKFTVYADSQSLDYLYEHFEAGADAGIFIGWWRIGGDAGYSSTKSETKVYKYADRIEFVDLSGRAKVLAVLCKYYAAGLSREPLSITITNADRQKAQEQIESEWDESSNRKTLSDVFNKDFVDDILSGPADQ